MRVNAITNNKISDLSLDRRALVRHNDRFNHELESSGVTHQRGSGRCWLFAGLNLFAPRVMADLKMKKFELSQPYLAFYDKLEKANRFLEDIIAFRDSALHTWTMQVVLESPFGDGGWWNYVTALLEKYGAVPLSAMPETRQSSSTSQINRLISTLLRRDAAELRQMYSQGAGVGELRSRKKEMLAEVYEMLVYAYGEPPTEFEFRYEVKPEKDSTAQGEDDTGDDAEEDNADEGKGSDVVEHHTPGSFYEKYLKPHMKEYVSICHNPAQEVDRLYELAGARNIMGSPDLQTLNLPIEKLKAYALKSLLDSQIVWFACDVGKENYGDSGIFMRGIYDVETTLGVELEMEKRDRIDYHDISPNHAMVFMGVDTTDDGSAAKWLVENSWGKKAGKEGKWTMYDSWFDEYVLMVIVDKELLSAEDAEKLKQGPVIVPYWEPFFAALRRL
jgi:bleomycin hydrolase